MKPETKELLLVSRRDAVWDGIHIPGGYELNPESKEQALHRLAFTEIGVEVLNPKLIFVHNWIERQHPYGHPISNIVVCESDQIPKVGEWYKETPRRPEKRMVQNHFMYSEVVFAYINGLITQQELLAMSFEDSPFKTFARLLSQRR